jgi:hypothetical protein
MSFLEENFARPRRKLAAKSPHFRCRIAGRHSQPRAIYGNSVWLAPHRKVHCLFDGLTLPEISKKLIGHVKYNYPGERSVDKDFSDQLRIAGQHTIGDLLRRSAERAPDKIAIRCREIAWTYAANFTCGPP